MSKLDEAISRLSQMSLIDTELALQDLLSYRREFDQFLTFLRKKKLKESMIKDLSPEFKIYIRSIRLDIKDDLKRD